METKEDKKKKRKMLRTEIITVEEDEPQNLYPSKESLTGYYRHRTMQIRSSDTGTVK